jgi:nucleotide-binding universal stress UspA family protein
VNPVVKQRVIVSLSEPDVDSRVMRTAISIAQALDAVLYAVDVQAIPKPSTPSAGGATPRIQDAYFTLSKSGGLPDDVDVRIVLKEGEPGTELVRLANRRTDLLVVGRGSGRRDRASTLSPVALACVANADCGVVVVPPEFRPEGESTHEVKKYAAAVGSGEGENSAV